MCILCQLGAGLFAPADQTSTASAFQALAIANGADPEALLGSPAAGAVQTLLEPQAGLGPEAGAATAIATAAASALQASTGPTSQYVASLISGSRWSATSLTFAFPSAASQYAGYATAGNEPNASGFAGVSAQMQSAIRAILTGAGAKGGYGSYASVANLQLSETGAGAADIQIARSSLPATAYTYLPDGSAAGGDVWFGTRQNFNTPTPGSYAWLTAIHELGHALGLKHSFDTSRSGAMPGDRDAMEYTVMSYRSYAGQSLTGYTNATYDYAQTLMMYDIAALQQMYGANFATNAGASTYTWNPQTGEMAINGVGQGAPGGNRVFETIWDGGGADTYDLSNYATDISLDLTPGGVTNFGTQVANLGDGRSAAGNVYNALPYQGDARSLIENGITGSGNDVLTGNEAANLLMGMGGNDTLSGGAGDDQLYGNQGADWLEGGVGNDGLYGGRGTDTLFGGEGEDRLFGNMASDVLYGGAGNDLLYGGQGDDVLSGGAGDDVLSGDLGADRYVFGAGEGRDLVLGFSADQGDRLDLQGQSYTVATAADGSALLQLSGGGAVELAGWNAQQISTTMFV